MGLKVLQRRLGGRGGLGRQAGRAVALEGGGMHHFPFAIIADASLSPRPGSHTLTQESSLLQPHLSSTSPSKLPDTPRNHCPPSDISSPSIESPSRTLNPGWSSRGIGSLASSSPQVGLHPNHLPPSSCFPTASQQASSNHPIVSTYQITAPHAKIQPRPIRDPRRYLL